MKKSQKKFFILTGSYGSGHNSAARALCNTISTNGDIYEIYDFVDFLFDSKKSNTIQKIYEFLTANIPFIRENIFSIADQPDIIKFLQTINTSKNKEKFEKIMKNFQPDFIICTYPLWGKFIEDYIKKYGKNFRTGVVITDALNPHFAWHMNDKFTDHYFCIDQQTQIEFQKKFNHKAKNITVSFFPIESHFFHNKTKKQKTKPPRIAFLLTNLGNSFIEKTLLELANTDFEILIIQGRNKKDFIAMKQLFFKTQNFIFKEFIPLIENLKNIDFMISKAGGAMISECIANDVPIIMPKYTTGQEKGNIDLIETNKLGIYETNPEKIINYINNFDFATAQKNFHAIKNPNSCQLILETIKG